MAEDILETGEIVVDANQALVAIAQARLDEYEGLIDYEKAFALQEEEFLRGLLTPEQTAELEAYRVEMTGRKEQIGTMLNETEEILRLAVKSARTTLKGRYHQVIYTAPSEIWDGKLLEKRAKADPTLLECRKPKAGYVQIRPIG